MILQQYILVNTNSIISNIFRLLNISYIKIMYCLIFEILNMLIFEPLQSSNLLRTSNVKFCIYLKLLILKISLLNLLSDLFSSD